MNYLTKLFFWTDIKPLVKVPLYIAASSIDVLSWHKNNLDPTIEGTTLHTNLGTEKEKINHVVEGSPENVNQIAFDGSFFKCTSHFLTTAGNMQKVSVWINPDNLQCFYANQPDDCKIFFKSGKNILICSQLQDLMSALLEHSKKQKERKKLKYGKKT
jgi:hypothetical protein